MTLLSASGWTAYNVSQAQRNERFGDLLASTAHAVCATCGISGGAMVNPAGRGVQTGTGSTQRGWVKRAHRGEVINQCAACAVERRRLPFPEKAATSIFNAPPSAVARMARA